MALSDFPTSMEEIRNDVRCSYDTVAQVWILEEQDDCYEWHRETNSWKIQGLPIGEVEAAPGSRRKRKADDEVYMLDTRHTRVALTANQPENGHKAKKEAQPKKNSAIWVTGLPSDTTFQELDESFSRWGGMIAKNIDTGKPRIKMYTDDQGNFNGEALITFFQARSVDQAILLADDRMFRGIGNDTIHVQEASLDYKKNKDMDAVEQNQAPRAKRDKAKAKQMYEEQMARLGDWSDEDPQEITPKDQAENKFADTVIIRNMFDLELLEQEKQERRAADAKGKRPEEGVIDTLADDLHEINDEKQWGRILSVDIYDGEPDGIVKVKFDSPESAMNCAKGLPAITFDDRHLQVEIATKRVRFRKAPKDEEDEALRLKWFGEDSAAGRLRDD